MRTIGIVPVAGRGTLPQALLRGRPLADHARRRLAAAGVEVLDEDTAWDAVRERGAPLVLHDPLCPLTPQSFLAEAVAAARETVVVGVRPVTDTIKHAEGDWAGATLDREALAVVTSPVVIPAATVADLAKAPRLDDFSVLVEELRRHADVDVRMLEAPSIGRRLDDESAVLLLEAVDER